MNQVLDFIKTHTLALVCGVIALIAIGVLFFYIPGQIEDVQAKVHEETEQQLTTLNELRNKNRTLPATNPAGGEPKPLEGFPTQATVDVGKAALTQLHDQAGASMTEIRRVNERPLLVPGALPDPSPIARHQFLVAYRAATAQTGPEAANGIMQTILHGALPPTPEEITAIGNARANEIANQRTQYDATHHPVNADQVNAAIADMRSHLEMQLRISRARTSQVYVSPNAVAISPIAGANQNEALLSGPTIFNAQVSLWLQQIAFEAIADCNHGAQNVFDAPVKHLVALNVPMEVAPGSGGAGAMGFGAPAASEQPAEGAGAPTLTPDPTAELKPVYQTSPFGYGHTALYDAIPIQMVIRLDVRQLPTVLETLGHGRLLKVNNVNLRTVDAGTALAEKYIYDQTGKTPMVEARLDCDVLFLRTWLAPLMPNAVKTYFANLSNPQPTS